MIWKKTSKDISQIIQDKYNYSHFLSDILSSTNVKLQDMDNFIHPRLENLHHWSLFPNISIIVDKIKHAISDNKKIMIYGDYDTDGITSTTVLLKTLLKMDADVSYFIPNRYEHGYGLNVNKIHEFKRDGIDLIITVDCGITNHEQIKLIKELGMDVIVTDHHNLSSEPNTDFINCKHEYPFPMLAGVGVAFKLAQALTNSDCYDLLALVATGTIADMMPLTDENRIFVYHGLKLPYVEKITTLFEMCVAESCDLENISPYDIGFKIAPRLNAVGRLDDANVLVKLLCSDDITFIIEMIQKLNKNNTQRKSIQEKILKEAKEKIQEYPLEHLNFIVVDGENWTGGVVGLVASNIKEEYNRPVLVINKGETVHGSGRSISSVNLYEACKTYEHLFERMGGHNMAVGFGIDQNNIQPLREALNRYISEKHEYTDLLKSIRYVTEINGFSKGMIDEIELFKPFGIGNEQPKFVMRDIEVVEKKLFKGKYMAIQGKKNGYTYEFFMFNGLEYFTLLGSYIDVIGTLQISTFNYKPQFIISDAIPSRNVLKATTREEFLSVYYIVSQEKKIYMDDLVRKIPDLCEKILYILTVFEELGFIVKIGKMIYFRDDSFKSLDNSQTYLFVNN